MIHIVESCRRTKFADQRLILLDEANDNAVNIESVKNITSVATSHNKVSYHKLIDRQHSCHKNFGQGKLRDRPCNLFLTGLTTMQNLVVDVFIPCARTGSPKFGAAGTAPWLRAWLTRRNRHLPTRVTMSIFDALMSNIWVDVTGIPKNFRTLRSRSFELAVTDPPKIRPLSTCVTVHNLVALIQTVSALARVP